MSNEAVILKSNKYGLTLQLDGTIPFEELVRKVCEKFASSADFFGETSMILETIGRELTNEEGLILIQAIELNSKIKVILLNENNELKDTRMLGQIDRFYKDDIFENAKIIRGSVTKNDIIESDSSIVILGDVKSKASVKAKGNVIVFGDLEGSAYAGYPDNTGCYIVAGELNSKNIQIGTITGDIKVQEKWSLRVHRKAKEPMGITVWNKELLAEPLSSGLLKGIK
ncbi:septum site-determining protein MinC [Pseudobutyrivibrio sp. OR37]|uniref:septum site-determining protein MinC n=1 Tax=Pseudobutyrivibrio sp. OR37 TaxID=1798186 RepID=UPI0008E31A5C|nr:septum site-determining protein MinC [Pseudobutyrivibrio sp. OR37]SFH60877.1 septum site-determining protein MinC [Pseudobutyrivibrio sp. OR37]